MKSLAEHVAVQVPVGMNVPPVTVGACLFVEPGCAKASAASAKAPAVRIGSANERFMYCSPFGWIRRSVRFSGCPDHASSAPELLAVASNPYVLFAAGRADAP